MSADVSPEEDPEAPECTMDDEGDEAPPAPPAPTPSAEPPILALYMPRFRVFKLVSTAAREVVKGLKGVLPGRSCQLVLFPGNFPWGRCQGD